MPQLQLWLHTATGERYIVMVNDAGVQLAADPLDDAAVRAAQDDEMTIPWQPGLADWVQQRLAEFETVWPPHPNVNPITP